MAVIVISVEVDLNVDETIATLKNMWPTDLPRCIEQAFDVDVPFEDQHGVLRVAYIVIESEE